MRFSSELFRRFLIGTLATGIVLGVSTGQAQPAQQPGSPPPPPGSPPTAPLPPEQLQQLVAPIALYPDALVAQILAASYYPTQIVEAERFLEEHPDWHGEKLGKEVDHQDWDPSVKGLCQFPDVLSNMNKDLSWTSELGDANYNQSQAVMQAIQFMRQKAQSAGNLSSTTQENVTDDGSDIDIAPAEPDVVYVPEYDPEAVYGYQVGLWPGFDPWWDMDGPDMSWGMGIGVEPFFGYGWGWGGWGMDWHNWGMRYHGGGYMPHTRAFYDRGAFMRGNYRGDGNFARGDRGLRGFGGGGGRGGGFGRQGQMRGSSNVRAAGGFNRGGTARGFSNARSAFGGGTGHSFAGTRSSAFGGFGMGGQARGFSSRGMSSMHGGGFGGGMRGGGFGGGMRGGGGGGMRGGGGHR